MGSGGPSGSNTGNNADNSDTGNSDTGNSDTGNSDISNSDISNSDISNSDISNSDISNGDNDGDGSGSSASTSEKNGDNATGLIVGIIAGVLVLVAIVGFLMFYLNKNKRNKNKMTKLTEIPDDVEMKTQKKMVDTQLSKIEGVELSMNPINSGNKNNVAHMKNVDYVISKKPPTHQKHLSDDGNAYFQEIGTDNTVWELPEDGVLNE